MSFEIDKTPRLQGGRLHAEEHCIRKFFVELPALTPLTHLSDPTYWRHCTALMKHGDFLLCRPECESWIAQLYVRDVQAGVGATVAMVWSTNLDTAVAPNTGDYAVTWRGGKQKFCITHRKTEAIIREGFANRDAATTWVRQNILKVA